MVDGDESEQTAINTDSDEEVIVMNHALGSARGPAKKIPRKKKEKGKKEASEDRVEQFSEEEETLRREAEEDSEEERRRLRSLEEATADAVNSITRENSSEQGNEETLSSYIDTSPTVYGGASEHYAINEANASRSTHSYVESRGDSGEFRDHNRRTYASPESQVTGGSSFAPSYDPSLLYDESSKNSDESKVSADPFMRTIKRQSKLETTY